MYPRVFVTYTRIHGETNDPAKQLEWNELNFKIAHGEVTVRILPVKFSCLLPISPLLNTEFNPLSPAHLSFFILMLF